MKLSETVFHSVNSTRKKLLRCAPYCDQKRYTKYDSDCSWRKDSVAVPHTTSTPSNKKKSRVKSSSCAYAVDFVSEEEFSELCKLISQIGFSYITKHKKRKSKFSRKVDGCRHSGQTTFIIVFIATVLPSLPLLFPGLPIFATLALCWYLLLRFSRVLTPRLLHTLRRIDAAVYHAENCLFFCVILLCITAFRSSHEDLHLSDVTLRHRHPSTYVTMALLPSDVRGNAYPSSSCSFS